MRLHRPDITIGRGLFLGTAAFFACALIAGGLGPHAAFANALIEAAAFVLLATLAMSERVWQSHPPAGSRSAALFVLAVLAVGFAQLIPLQPSVWQALPGREPVADLSITLGFDALSRPLSLSPVDTRLVLQSLLPPIAMFFATAIAPAQERVWFGMVAVAVAVASASLGLLQLTSGGSAFIPYRGGSFDRFPGVFANFNHQAVFLACALVLLPIAAVDRRTRTARVRIWPIAVAMILLFGALVTSSRAGLILFAVAALVTTVRMGRPSVRRSRALIPAVLLIAGAGAIFLIVGMSYRGELMSARFGTAAEDARFTFWTTTWAAIQATWPYGTGLGTFGSVYQMYERLEDVRDFVVNHAHNDYLELVLEAGVAGVALVTAFLAWLGARLIALRRLAADDRRQALTGAIVVALVLLHSIVDYPLRTETIGCLFAFACGLLVPAPHAASRSRA